MDSRERDANGPGSTSRIQHFAVRSGNSFNAFAE
jgi:hypothetical protein